MKKFICLPLFLWAIILPLDGAAESIDVGEGLAVEVTLPAGHWQLLRQAPDFLVVETAEHLEHELAAQGKKPAPEDLRSAAQRRLEENEGFICNPASGACLTIDFSPLAKGEGPPSSRVVGLSAKYAGEGLAEEEGVSGLQQQSRKISVPGAAAAYRIDARYRHHEEPRQFIGIVGFRDPSWFYLYYTDHGRDPADLAGMEAILKTLAVRGSVGR